MPVLPLPPSGPGVVDWVTTHLGHLSGDVVDASAIRGGQAAADAALDGLDLTGYARRRSQVLPESARGATRMSPYIRHGLLTLPQVWNAAGSAPPADRSKYRDELMWQEYARHLYARLGPAMGTSLRTQPPVWSTGDPAQEDGWPTRMACMELTVGDLEQDGWLVNQTRMWLASQWSVRAGADWREGEHRFFTHLLDGSRAANRLGWQWTVGTGTGRPYGFSRWQVRKRAPELCAACTLRDACPIERWPDATAGDAHADGPTRADLRHDPDLAATAGPAKPALAAAPDHVWLTAESLGDADPALTAHPGLPAVFVFDAPLLARWRLSGKRLIFLAETLGDLATRREVRVLRGDPVSALAGRQLAATFTPVPGWARRAASLDVADVHPWPWLVRPHDGGIGSFSAWRKRGGPVTVARVGV